MNLVDLIEETDPLAVSGRVAQAVGIVIEGYGPMTSVGELCDVTREDGEGTRVPLLQGYRPGGGGCGPASAHFLPTACAQPRH